MNDIDLQDILAL